MNHNNNNIQCVQGKRFNEMQKNKTMRNASLANTTANAGDFEIQDSLDIHNPQIRNFSSLDDSSTCAEQHNYNDNNYNSETRDVYEPFTIAKGSLNGTLHWVSNCNECSKQTNNKNWCSNRVYKSFSTYGIPIKDFHIGKDLERWGCHNVNANSTALRDGNTGGIYILESPKNVEDKILDTVKRNTSLREKLVETGDVTKLLIDERKELVDMIDLEGEQAFQASARSQDTGLQMRSNSMRLFLWGGITVGIIAVGAGLLAK